MSQSDCSLCRSLINDPIDESDNPIRAAMIEQCQTALARDGCAVFKDFLSTEGLRVLLAEAEERQSNAYFSPEKSTNVYFSADDPTLPNDHPRRIFFKPTNGFLTSDLFGE